MRQLADTDLICFKLKTIAWPLHLQGQIGGGLGAALGPVEKIPGDQQSCDLFGDAEIHHPLQRPPRRRHHPRLQILIPQRQAG